MTVSPIPVTIVTGFLGSGKTTLLNRLLRAPDLADTVVIVNEFGEVGLDHLLIEQAIENTVLLKNGCICCTVRGDVADTLETLWQQRAAGTIPPFRRIAIETTGLADPGPVAHALLPAPGASYACTLDGIVTTVDAQHGADTLARHPEARRQVALADRLFLTKTDLANPAPLEAALDRINTHAARLLVNAVAPEDVFGLGPGAEDVFGPGAEDVFGPGPAPEAWLGLGHTHHHAEIGTVLLTHDAPIGWDALSLWLDSVLSLRGAQVLRLKGLLHLHGEAAPVVLQGVHHVLHPLTRLPAWPAAPRTQLVLITQGLSPRGLRASFDHALSQRPS